MDATTKFASNVTLINITEQETFNATSSNVSGWEYPPVGFFVYYWISLTLTFGLPFPLLFIGNVIIVVQLSRSRSRRQRMNISGQARNTRTVSMLMTALCVLFLLTITPLYAYMVYFPYLREKLYALALVDPHSALYDAAYIQFLYDVAVLVSFFNATFNFAIYVFSGSKFRAELRSLFCCRAKQSTSLFWELGADAYKIFIPPAAKYRRKSLSITIFDIIAYMYLIIFITYVGSDFGYR